MDRLLELIRDLDDKAAEAPESSYREGFRDALDYVVDIIREEFEL